LFEPRAQTWQQVIEFNPAVGWKPKANLNTYCSFLAGVFHIKTDSEGWRGKTSIVESDIVVFGDSFAFSYGMDESKQFSNLYSGLRIKAIGAPGYNMVQGLLWMRQLCPLLRGKLVVWFLCLGNDLYDNLQPNMQNYRTPFVRETNGNGSWQIVTMHIRPETWPYDSEGDFLKVRDGRYTGTFAETFLAKRAYSACEFLIGEADKLCKGAGGQLAVVSVPVMSQMNQKAWEHWTSRVGDPNLFDRELPDKKIQRICHELGVPFLAGSKYLDYNDHIPEDGHWNEKGHRRIAEILSDLHQSHMVKSAPDKEIRFSPRSPETQGATLI
jgi:hypothetical protein